MRSTISLLLFWLILAPVTGRAQLKWADRELSVVAPFLDEQVVRFTYINTSSKQVKVLRVKSSCGCGVVEDLPSEIAPGASGELRVRLRPHLSAKDKDLAIIVRTDVPSEPNTILQVHLRSAPN